MIRLHNVIGRGQMGNVLDELLLLVHLFECNSSLPYILWAIYLAKIGSKKKNKPDNQGSKNRPNIHCKNEGDQLFYKIKKI